MKSRRSTDLLDYVHDDTGENRTYLLARPSILPQRPPPQLDTWEDLLVYEPEHGEPPPPKWMLVAHGDDGIALGRGGPLTEDERAKLLLGVELVSMQRAASGASKSDTMNRWTGTALTVIIGLAVVLTIAIVLIGMAGYLGSLSEPDASTDFVVQEPSATPIPDQPLPRTGP